MIGQIELGIYQLNPILYINELKVNIMKCVEQDKIGLDYPPILCYSCMYLQMYISK